MNIIILGPQGSGKGTQAQRIAEKYFLKHISSGDIIRKEIENKNPTALAIQDTIKKGKLVSEKLIFSILKKHIQENGNIFDGFPRTLEQAELLDEEAHINLMIELKLSDNDAIKRILQRKQCSLCNAVYGKENPSKKPNICDNDGTKLVFREDDTKETIQKRLDIYRDETEPLVEYYKPRDIVFSVDGNQSIEKIFKTLCAIIEEQLNLE